VDGSRSPGFSRRVPSRRWTFEPVAGCDEMGAELVVVVRSLAPGPAGKAAPWLTSERASGADYCARGLCAESMRDCCPELSACAGAIRPPRAERHAPNDALAATISDGAVGKAT